ncbi:MAG: DUF6776 family protein [Steroidobacteraceae bacterium]
MASFSPLHTGQFIIKQRSIRHRRTKLVMLAILLVLLPYVTFELGRLQAGYSVVNSARAYLEQTTRINKLTDELAQARRQLSNAQLDKQVQMQAGSAMQQSVTALKNQIQQQQQDLAFYQAIVTPAAGATNVPQVQRIEIEQSGAAEQYVLRLVLIQTMSATGNARGTVTMQVSGMLAGNPVVLSVTDLLIDKSDTPLEFNYRYFQVLEPQIELPAGFEPSSVLVEVRAAQHEVLRQNFAWQIKPLLSTG